MKLELGVRLVALNRYSARRSYERIERNLRRNTDRFSAHRLAQFALAVALIITVKLVKWAKRWDSMAVA